MYADPAGCGSDDSWPDQFRFTRSGDHVLPHMHGVNLAVACAGQGMLPVRPSFWLTHLYHDWQNPVRGPLWHFLADRFRLVRYDGRGLGFSGRDVADISFAAFERDLEAVVDALKLRRYALLAGC